MYVTARGQSTHSECGRPARWHVPLTISGAFTSPQRCRCFPSSSSQRLRRNSSQTAASDRVYSVQPVPEPLPEGRNFTWAGWVAAATVAAIIGAAVYRLLQRKQEQEVEETQGEWSPGNHQEDEDFKAVLSSVRQVVTFQRAVQSMRSGDTARAMVELYRVLEQNAICRLPLNTASFSREELEDVYRLHLCNSELPLQYSTLLHLRQLLKLSDPRAEELEKELKGSAYEFSI